MVRQSVCRYVSHRIYLCVGVGVVRRVCFTVLNVYTITIFHTKELEHEVKRKDG